MTKFDNLKNEIDTLLGLAFIYMNYGKTKRAIDYLLIAYKLDPSNLQVKKMKISAFRDIGAFSQALDIVHELEQRTDLSRHDALTLMLMKSLCLKGLDRLEEGRVVFSEYIKQRKEFATKQFMKNYHKKIMFLKQQQESSYEAGDFNVNNEIHQFVKRTNSGTQASL